MLSKEEAKKYINKKIIFYTDDKKYYSNYYIGILENVMDDRKFPFKIKHKTKVLYKVRNENCHYNEKSGFFVTTFFEKVKLLTCNKNYMFDF